MRILIFLIFLILIGCNSEYVEIDEIIEEDPAVNSIKISTDKEVYNSKEIVKMQIEVDSVHENNKLQLAIYGIEVDGKPRMYEVIPINLTKGNNLVMYGYKLPDCNTCSGIPAGNYDIHAELYHQNLLVNETIKTIELQK